MTAGAQSSKIENELNTISYLHLLKNRRGLQLQLNAVPEALKASLSKIRLKPLDWLLLTILLAVECGFTAWFVLQENAFYWSDYNYYYIATIYAVRSLCETPLQFPLFLWLSTHLTHNMLFTAPILPVFMALGGASRLAYVLSLVVTYLTSYLLILGFTLSQVFKASPRAVVWATVLAGITVPTFWIPFLRGYPDACGAISLTLALLIYLQAYRKLSTRHLLLIGFFIALAPLLRRHFAYVGIFCALTIFADLVSPRFPAGKQEDGEELKKPSWRWKVLAILKMSLAAGATFGTVGILFVFNTFSCHWSDLYKSFQLPPLEAAGYFGTAYGAIAWLMAAAGFFLCYRDKLVDRAKFTVLIAFSLISILCWIFVSGQTGAHYTFYCDWFIVIGETAFFLWLMSHKIRKNAFLLATFLTALYAVFNVYTAFRPTSLQSALFFKSTRFGMLSKALEEGDGLSRLFSAYYPPLVVSKADRETLISLAIYLQSLTLEEKGKEKTIYCNGQSDSFDVDIVRNAQRAHFHLSNFKMADVPATNTRDSYPLEQLNHSDIVIVSEPLQCFIDPRQQQILAVVNQCFYENWGPSCDFTRLPKKFQLENGVRLDLFLRQRPTTAVTTALAMTRMQQLLPVRPGSQVDFITSGEPSPVAYEPTRNHFMFYPGKTEGELFLLYTKALPPTFNVRGRLSIDSKNKEKTPVKLTCQLLDQDGKPCGEASTIDLSKAGEKFLLNLKSGRGIYFVIYLENKTTAGSEDNFTIEDLNVSPARPQNEH